MCEGGHIYCLRSSQISRELADILIIHIHSLSVTLYKHEEFIKLNTFQIKNIKRSRLYAKTMDNGHCTVTSTLM